MIRTYTELSKMNDYLERFKYLSIGGRVGEETFGFDRYLNQIFYRSPEWKQIRNYVIVRDNGCDMGFPGREILGRIIVHHLNPITPEDIFKRNPDILNPEFLVCVSHRTHEAISYGDESLLMLDPVERVANDTCPWR